MASKVAELPISCSWRRYSCLLISEVPNSMYDVVTRKNCVQEGGAAVVLLRSVVPQVCVSVSGCTAAPSLDHEG